MTQIERLARELAEVGGYPFNNNFDIEMPYRETWLRLARHVLRRERRVRGRTVAWAIGSPVYEFAGQKDTRPIGYDWSFVEEPVNVRMTHMMGKRVARVVAVPKRKKGGRK